MALFFFSHAFLHRFHCGGLFCFIVLVCLVGFLVVVTHLEVKGIIIGPATWRRIV